MEVDVIHLPPLFFTLTYKVWPDNENVLLDATDDNPNGWYRAGGHSGCKYTIGTGASFTNYYNGYWLDNGKAGFPYTDAIPVQTSSYTGTDISSYSQVQITYDIGSHSSGCYGYLRLGYHTSSQGQYQWTKLIDEEYINTTRYANTSHVDTFTLLNAFTSAPACLGVGVTYYEWIDTAEDWDYRTCDVTISKIELLK